MITLQDEIASYEQMRSELEAAHLGKWALVHERVLVGVFEDFMAAAGDAIRKFGRGPYLIRQIGAPKVTLPASVMYRQLHASDELRLP